MAARGLALAGSKVFAGTGSPIDEEVARFKRELARVKKERDHEDLTDAGETASKNRIPRLMASHGL